MVFLGGAGTPASPSLALPMCRYVVRCRGRKSLRVHVCFSICVVNKTASPPFIHTEANGTCRIHI